jgi:Rod binding domain-containing protein
VANVSAFGGVSGVVIGPLASSASQVIRQAASAVTENSKIEKSAKDFESILLGSWLQQAEQSFGSVPGGDDDDADAGKDQFQGMAMQSLGTSMTASGGIGIAKMISKQLHKADDARVAIAAKTSHARTE